MTPNLNDFNLHHLGVSGGKDSTAVALWLRFESRLSVEQMDITFCDTNNEDPLTYAFLDLLRSVLAPVPIRVLRPERDFWELAAWKGRFPSTKARFCTQYLKVIPTRAEVQRLLQAGNQVLVMNGVRRAEGHANNNRADALEWEDAWESWGTWLYRPIVGWSLGEVWDIHRKYISLDDVIALVWADPTMADDMKTHLATKIAERGIPTNPLYAMGASRVGCWPCIESRKGEIRLIEKYRPERIDFLEGKEHSFTRRPQGISTFFPPNMTPPHLRSLPVVTKAGKIVNVPTIRDVVDWSKTSRGGKQYDMDFDLPASACDIGGMCE